MTEQQERDYWPTDDWRTAPAQTMGMDVTLLAQMRDYITNHLPGLQSLLIVRHGYLVFEEYYQGFHQNSYNSISSATKSVVSALVGVALTQGLLSSLDQRMLDFFPEFAAIEIDPRKQAVTLRHLMSLTAGFSQAFPDHYWLNPVQLAIERAMAHQPGAMFAYDSQGVDIVSAIITRITGQSAAAFADATLFKTLGIWRSEHARFTWRNDPDGKHTWHGDAYWDEKNGHLWKVDPQGYSTGGFGAHFTSREMAKFGYLYLNKGIWDGQQIIPIDFVAASTSRQSDGSPSVNRPYGYLWWIVEDEKHPAFFASGFGGKLIYIVPSLDLVVVTTASTEEAIKNRQQTREITDLVPRFILPAAHSHVD